MAKVLVVDDHASNRELIVTLLKYARHEPFEAADGHLALEQVRAVRPELVICDILMPTMDGYEFVRQLRADPDIAHTEVIFYTAVFMEREARSLARSCGVSNVLIKPCEPEEILRTVEHAMTRGLVTEPLSDTAEFDRDHLRLLTDKLTSKVNELASANLRLTALNDLNLQLASERDPYTLLDKVCRGARDLLGARCAVLAARQKDGSESIHWATWGLDGNRADRLRRRTRIDTGLLGQVMADGSARRFSNPDGDPVSAGLSLDFPSMQCGLIAPVVSLHRVYGWVLLIDKLGADAFTAEDERLLVIHAAQAGRIYENGSLYNEIVQTAEQLQREIVGHERTSNELRMANDTLEQRVKLRTSELREIIEGLESFNRNVSHDLRGPLGGIAGAARMARGFLAKDETKNVDRFLEAIGSQAETTVKMVDALLELARTSDVTLLRRSIGMNALAREVVESLQEARAAGPMPVVVRPLPDVDADPELARQVFANLIGNALKFASGAVQPEIEVGVTDSPGGPVFFVRDNGVGFEATKAHRLFQPFQRLHGAPFVGFGVGLSIVKRIIDRHGGRLWAESLPGQGATFYFSFDGLQPPLVET